MTHFGRLQLVCITILTSVPLGTTGYAQHWIGKCARERHVAEMLRQPVVIDVADAPLSAAVEALKHQTDVAIEFDSRAMDRYSLDGQVLVSLHVSDLPLATTFDLVLSQHDLTHICVDGVVLITTPERASKEQATRIYRSPTGITANESIRVLQDLASPDDFRFSSVNEELFAVRGSHVNHRMVADLLDSVAAGLAATSKDSHLR